MPAIVSKSASCSILGGNSTNSRSQLTENFMPDLRCQCCGASVSSRELPQETQIVLREKTNIWNIEQNHGEPIHPQAEGETSPLLRIVSTVTARCVYGFEDGRMDHSAPTNFNPLFASFHRFRFYIDLKTRFRERKIMRPKPHGGVCSEKLAQEKFKSPLQIGNADVFIHVKP